MKYISTILIITGMLFFSLSLYADDYLDSAYKVNENEFDYSFSSDDFGKTPFRTFNFFQYIFNNESPRIDINYNFNQISIDPKEFYDSFNNTPELEIKAGYVVNSEANNGFSTKSNFEYLRLSTYNSQFGQVGNANRITMEGWQFGLGSTKGYGWSFGKNVSMLLYHGNNFNWHIMTFNDQPKEYIFNNKLDKISNQFKFGNSFEAGIDIRLYNSLGINAAYEQAHIFPAHLFWYWGASKVIEEVAKSFTNNFIQKISNRNSIAGPVINFIIKNGISYGMYELRKTNMNWPITTESPLAIEKFKVGLTYTF